MNSGALVNRGMGVIVHYEDITFETITKAIKFALDSETQENAKKVSYSFKNRMNSPLDTAIWWAEHVAETGGAGLVKPYGTNLSGFIYHSFDIYLFLLACFLTTITCIGLTFRWCCCRRQQTIGTKTKMH